MRIITFHAGSNSLTLEFVQTGSSFWGRSLLSGSCDDLGKQHAQCSQEIVDREECIMTAQSPLQIWVVPTQEELMMAHHVARA